MGFGEGKQERQKTKMAERRKSSKPIMEKRRRERINNSLNELKNLLLESRKKDTTCCSKLEKADILEMTVQYLKSIRSQQEKASTTSDPVALAHYRAGFNHSAMEISRYLIDTPDIEVKVRSRLLTYLSNSCHAALNNQALMKQHYPSGYPTPIHQAPEKSTHVPKDTSLSTAILGDPTILAITPPEAVPYYFNPSQLLMPSSLTNGKLAAVLMPNPNLCSSPTQQRMLGQHFKLEPGSSTSTITHGQELHRKDAHISNNESNSSTHTRSRAPAPADGSVWRPWS
ncbi:transcription factor HES-4-B-like isoform X2 [Dendronephthya gigantea]|uniref:transcription factor HES-4-B-like isoform X2 n=1 Tax=Dendronephthya gigantea TaxID=151771 RepID=UPI00106A8AAF|nr:transcription factor HES-4-B-like isoform X2 [Dendronephthya gigantea]